MSNGKIVKYKKVFKITVQGKADTKFPEMEPLPLMQAERILREVVVALNYQYSWRDVSIKEIKR